MTKSVRMRTRPFAGGRRGSALKRGRYGPNNRAPRIRKRLRPRSATRTMTKRKLNQGVHENRGGSESTFVMKKAARGLGRLAQKMQKLQYAINESGIITGSAGVQVVNEDFTLFDSFDVATLMTQTLNQQFGGPTPRGFKTEKIFLHSVKAEYAYNNNTTDQVRMQIYNYVPKRDIYTGAGAPGVIDANTGSSSWDIGLSSQGLGGGSNTVVGQTPFGSEMFCRFFTIVKITNVVLAPGQTHYHKVIYHPNKMIFNDLIQQGNVTMIKDITMGQMTVVYGAPTVTAVGTGVTTEATKVLQIFKGEFEWSYIPNNETTSTMGNTLPITGTGAELNMVTGRPDTFASV